MIIIFKEQLVECILPAVIIVTLLALATINWIWTLLSLFLLLPFTVRVIHWKLIAYRKAQCTGASKFHFSFTITSITISYLVFEIEVMSYMEITSLEYLTNISLLVLILYTIYKTKELVAIDTNSSSTTGITTGTHSRSQSRDEKWNYCRRCLTYVEKRNHHCVWLNTCIGQRNLKHHIVSVAAGAAWIFHTSYLTLTTICYPQYLFRLFGARLLLVPYACPDLYHDWHVTICFVTVIYGLILAVLLVAVLFHQFHLMWRGVASYAELKQQLQNT